MQYVIALLAGALCASVVVVDLVNHGVPVLTVVAAGAGVLSCISRGVESLLPEGRTTDVAED